MGNVMVDLREIEAFLAVADELHFGRAAERLQISQPRISQVVRTMERRIGAPLFARSSRKVELTPLGERLRSDLAPAYEALRSGIARARASARGVEGLLHVGFLGTAANELTQRILAAFRERHPGCEVKMTETHFADPLGPLRGGKVDILITRLPVEEPDLVVGPVVVREPRVLAVGAGHPFAGRKQVSMEDLARDRVFAVSASAPDYWWDFHVPPTTPGGAVIERGAAVATFQELLALVASGEGISPVAESVARYYGRPDIAYVPLPDAPPTEVALVWRADGLTARARALAQAAADVVRANGGPAGAADARPHGSLVATGVSHTLGAMTSARDSQYGAGDEPARMTFYEAVGGEETFTRLVRRFYEGVAGDPVLRPMYPEEDLGPAEERLRLFLVQYWGGPRTYSERRGHPRLRMRHVPFRIGAAERDRWLGHMRAAVDSLELDAGLERQLWEYMVMAAHSLVNVAEESTAPEVADPTRMSVSSEENGDDDGESVTISLKR